MTLLKADSLPFPETYPECSVWCYCMISHGLNIVTIREKWTFIYTVNITRYLQIWAGRWHENEECPYLQKSYLMSLFPITIPFNDHYKETYSSRTRNNIYNSFVKTNPVDIQKLCCFLSYWNKKKKELLTSVNRKLVVVVVMVVVGGAVEAIIFWYKNLPSFLIPSALQDCEMSLTLKYIT